MNVKKVITVVLAVFLLCAVFCGTVSAINVQTSSLEVNPSGSLVTGDLVSATITVDVPKDTYTDTDSTNRLELSTDLDAANWTVDIKSGTTTLVPVHDTGKKITIGNFTLYYPNALTLEISVSGVVSSGDAGQNIVVMKIDSYERTGKYPTWSTNEQYVYNSASLAGELAVLESDINALQARINVYAGEGCDVSKAQAHLDTANSQYRDAKSAGTADVRTAYSKIEAAQTSLKNAGQEFAFVSLSLSTSYINWIDGIIKSLEDKGWSTEAMLLEAKNLKLHDTYDQQLAAYNARNPDAAALDKLAEDSYLLYQDALVYEESAKNPLGGVLTYLPFILIGLGAVAIIVVIVVVIVKKRKNSWDELG